MGPFNIITLCQIFEFEFETNRRYWIQLFGTKLILIPFAEDKGFLPEIEK